MKSWWIVGFCFLPLVGCYKINDPDDLRAVPTTNNPHLVPESAKTISPQSLKST